MITELHLSRVLKGIALKRSEQKYFDLGTCANRKTLHGMIQRRGRMINDQNSQKISVYFTDADDR